MSRHANTLPRPRDVVIALFAALVLGGGGFILATTYGPREGLSPRAAHATPVPASAHVEAQLPPPGDDLLALLGGLAPGDRLGPCDVSAIHGVVRGKAIVVAERDGDTVDFEIFRLVEGGPEPPAQTERYGVFYRISGAPGRRLEQGMVESAARALAERIGKHENDAPAPAGMEGSDTLAPRPGKTL